MQAQRSLMPFIAAMAVVVVASNYLVQFPVNATVAGFNLADLLTFGAFTYPVAFLVTDLTNRKLGPRSARLVVIAGFAVAVLLSIWLATPRIAIASGSAFLVAQLLDVFIFDKLRRERWWKAPFISTLVGSVIDTVIFFSIAFAPAFGFIGANDDFAIAAAPLLGLAIEAPRWISWALGDFVVKILVSLVMLAPYGVLLKIVRPEPAVEAVR